MNESNKILFSEEVLQFVGASKDYCSLLETQIDLEQGEFIRFNLYCLPAIYSSMIRIPQLEPVFEEGSEKFVSEQDWSEVYRKVAECMEGSNDFLDIPAESEFDRSELITRKVSEDMADIYQDLRDFLEIFRNAPEEVMNDALWECQNNFISSWGSKVLRVTSAMHKIFSGDVKSGMDSGIGEKTPPEIDTRNWFISKRQQEYGNEDDFFTEH